jgi:hypothetical protein
MTEERTQENVLMMGFNDEAMKGVLRVIRA